MCDFLLQTIENQKDWYKNMYKSLHKTDKPKGERRSKCFVPKTRCDVVELKIDCAL